ncbi:MAG TPA: hypothetical protein VG077_10375 [Verrucomicrobiae bacterium]|nr:hypothetical protein [Verrucomicrobiae bacterium]
MKSEARATVASARPVTAGEPGVIQPHKIPLAAKVVITAFLAVLVPVYLHTYGPAKTFTSSFGRARCGWSPFSPRTWPCAKSSPRHRQRPDGKSQFDFKFLPAGQPDLDSLMVDRITPDGAAKVFGRMMWSEMEHFSKNKNQPSPRNNHHETQP